VPTFFLEGDCRSALARLFKADAEGRLRFGWSGHSLQAATLDDLLSGPVRFRDYIMEGFLTYGIRAEDSAPGCVLHFQGEGSNRDWSIGPQARHFIKAAGVAVSGEADA